MLPLFHCADLLCINIQGFLLWLIMELLQCDKDMVTIIKIDKQVQCIL